jgi:hypothetical protein
MDDQKLVALSNEVDKILHTMCGKYDINALSLTGVVLARLKIIADAGEITKDFNKLLAHVSVTDTKPRKFTIQ